MLKETDSLLEVLLEPVFIAAPYIADDGRPLAELTATEEAREGVDFELRRCPYSGSRFEKDMNISAMPGLSREIKHVISDTIYLRDRYLEYKNLDKFNLLSFWFFTRVLDTLPIYLVRRKENSANKHSIAARVSAMFKAAQGLHLAPELLVMDGDPLDSPVDVDDILNFIERRNIFIENNRACAGPPAMIRAFTASAVVGEGKREADFGMSSLLSDDEISVLFAYADAVTILFAAKLTYEAESRLVVDSVVNGLCDPTLIETIRLSLVRFGSLKNHRIDILQKVADHLEPLLDKSSINSCGEFSDKARLHKMLCLRNPQMVPDQVESLTDMLIQSCERDRQWATFFTKQQKRVLVALGHAEQMPEFSSRYLTDLNYSSVHVLSELLNIESYTTGVELWIKAGATCEMFSWSAVD